MSNYEKLTSPQKFAVDLAVGRIAVGDSTAAEELSRMILFPPVVEETPPPEPTFDHKKVAASLLHRVRGLGFKHGVIAREGDSAYRLLVDELTVVFSPLSADTDSFNRIRDMLREMTPKQCKRVVADFRKQMAAKPSTILAYYPFHPVTNEQ